MGICPQQQLNAAVDNLWRTKEGAVPEGGSLHLQTSSRASRYTTIPGDFSTFLLKPLG